MSCPNCGYCPLCGRSNAPQYPVYPRPYYPSYPWWGTTSGTAPLTIDNPIPSYVPDVPDYGWKLVGFVSSSFKEQ